MAHEHIGRPELVAGSFFGEIVPSLVPPIQEAPVHERVLRPLEYNIAMAVLEPPGDATEVGLLEPPLCNVLARPPRLLREIGVGLLEKRRRAWWKTVACAVLIVCVCVC